MPLCIGAYLNQAPGDPHTVGASVYKHIQWKAPQQSGDQLHVLALLKASPLKKKHLKQLKKSSEYHLHNLAGERKCKVAASQSLLPSSKLTENENISI